MSALFSPKWWRLLALIVREHRAHRRGSTIEDVAASDRRVVSMLDRRPSQRDARSPSGNLPAADIARREDRGQ